MTTLDRDVIRLNMLSVGPITYTCQSLGLEWPPPERIIFDEGKVRAATNEDDRNLVLLRTNMSSLTDEQAQGSDHLARGAEYTYERLANAE